jgi:hypothetical protein
MAEVPYAGITAGGHTFNMTYVYHGDEEDNVGACTTCHPSAEDFDLDGAQTEIEELLEDLKLALADLGVFDSDTALWNVPRGDSLVVSADVAGAMINYKVVEEDRSLGIHNPPYIKALLTNTLEALQ